MRLIRSRAIDGVAVQSLTITKRSPMITPEFGSPSAVYAQQCADSCSKVIFLSARSAWLAKALLIGVPRDLLLVKQPDFTYRNALRIVERLGSPANRPIDDAIDMRCAIGDQHA